MTTREMGIQPTRNLGIALAAAALASVLLAVGAGVHPAAAAAVGLFLYALWRGLIDPKQPFPLPFLMILIAALQWGVAPIGAYADFYSERYRMLVPAAEYFPYAVGGLFALFIGLSIASRQDASRAQLRAVGALQATLVASPSIPIWLTLTALVCTAAVPFVSGDLGFLLYLGGNMKFVAAIMFLLSVRRDKIFWVAGIMSIGLLEAAYTSLFHDIALWFLIIMPIGWKVLRLRVPVRLAIILLAILTAFLIQGTKQGYREQVWFQGTQDASVSLFTRTLGDGFTAMIENEDDRRKFWAQATLRANQGWIISHVMHMVPTYAPYAKGQTLLDAISAAAVPRFLLKDKAKAGGRANIDRFTRLHLNKGTSMGVSTLGEAYGNFGAIGGVALMFVFGACLSLLMRGMFRFACWNPYVLPFVPLVFLHALKAETDFTTVINFILKALIFAIAVSLALRFVSGQRRVDISGRSDAAAP